MNAPTVPAPFPVAIVRARLATCAVFFILGSGAGLWAVHIPLVKTRLGIDEATLGLALLTLAVGAVIAMPLTGGIVGRYGSRRTTTVLSVAFAIAMPLPMLAPSVPLLFALAFLFGLGLSSLDVAMNVQAAEVEKARGRPTMSSFHGFYSLGGLAGAGAGALIVAAGWGDGRGALVYAGLMLLAALAGTPHLLPPDRSAELAPRLVLPNRAVIAVGVLTLLCFALEGAVADWSALFLAADKAASPAGAAAGFGLFSVAMASLRLAGDGLVAGLGGRRTLFAGGALVALGTALAILSPVAWLSAVGFGLVGAGAANIVPVLFSAAARTPGVPAGIGVAAVATMGYCGYLFAPPLIGFLAKGFGLPAALVPIGLAGAVIAASYRAVR